MAKLFILFIFVFFTACGSGTSASYRPMLWKITGNALTKPSYIFGTFHTRDPQFATFPASVLKYLESSQRLYTEIAMTPRAEKKIARFTQALHPTLLKKRLHPKTRKLLLRYLIDNKIPYTLQTLTPFKTWAIALMLTNQEKKRKGKSLPFMDERLMLHAKQKGIKHAGLESPEEQLRYFDALTDKQQETFLVTTMKEEKNIHYKQALKAWYKQGKSSGFLALQQRYLPKDKKAQKLSKLLTQTLLIERNQRFARRIHILMQSNKSLSYFFAIGAGHLSTDQSVLDALKQLGYTLSKP